MSTDKAVEVATIADDVCNLLAEGLSPAKARDMLAFARHFLRRVPVDELPRRPQEDWAALIRDQFFTMQERGGDQTRIRIFNPTHETHGWTCANTVLEVVSSDRPFLVDTTTMAITNNDVGVNLIVHPVYRVARDQGGYLMRISTLRENLEGSETESVMHFEIDKITDQATLDKVEQAVTSYLRDVQAAVSDWTPMNERLMAAAQELEQATTPYADEIRAECCEFLRWMAEDHFTLLGYREYVIEGPKKSPRLTAITETSLGILRRSVDEGDENSSLAMESSDPQVISEAGPLVITKTNAKATVHRSGYMDYIGVMQFDDEGRLKGEKRFLGLYTSSAYNRRPWNIPFVRRKVADILDRSGFAPSSHGAKALFHIMETLPRDELFQASLDQLNQLVIGVFDLQERQKTRLFVRADQFHRFFSCMVFIPRDRFNTETREKVQGILKRSLRGDSVDFTVQISDSHLARLHVIVHVAHRDAIEYSIDEIEQRLVEAVRSWHDRLKDILVEKHGEEIGLQWARRFGRYFPAAYIEEVTPWVAAFDVANLAQLSGSDDLRMSLYRPRQKVEGVFRFKLFRVHKTIPLSDVLPMLENMGLRVVSERPYRLILEDKSVRWIQDFDLQSARGGEVHLDRIRDNFQSAFEQVIRENLENDGFNRLILAAGLSWQQVKVLRSYCKYLVQTGVPFSQVYMESTLAAHPEVARMLVEYFEACFSPDRDGESKVQCEQRVRSLKLSLAEVDADWLNDWAESTCGDRKAQIAAAEGAIRILVEAVKSLDEDRILRAFSGVMQATLRTNAFQNAANPAPYLCLKLDSARVPDLPRPRPWREIFVYSPRVEGIHLRGGKVARGGLRWSDRREDFRTEVLGLMKAQMVKNTLIVPVGAKGGFVCKRLPEGDRDAVMAEVVSCYRQFINGLLDITDNLKDTDVVHPESVVRLDEDDPYLVVAADKGTATFSDIANSISEAHDFWMGDAFASGGSVGYDHKGMGITAKGAWESVKRNFREMGVDCQNEPFTVVGIGDMSGDVFGNGMLLSRKIRLKAAFNHMHIFLDPDPDPEASFAERERLFRLPRSQWTDYDQALISEGGGIFSRSEKTITLSPQVRQWLGIDEDRLTPNALLRELLKAPVDLLWNGGIGTYVKAASETNHDAGDRANDALRVNGAELRCKVVGEGGNLGLTQRGRIEYALAGGRVNTDFIDNSAGVDCSDHEVNIKILLNRVMADGLLGVEERNQLLASMTDEVSELVLRNNYLQTQALSMMEAFTVERLGSKAHFIDVLESQGILDRELEHLPSRDEINERRKRGLGLTRPELAVLLSYSKITLYQELLDSDVPEDPYLSKELERYFPLPLQERYADAMQSHRLRREIISTVITNSMVNRMGATFALRMEEDTGAWPSHIAKAYSIAREIFNARAWWEAIEAHDVKVSSETQTRAHLIIWNLLRHITRWILNHHRDDLNISALVDRYRDGVKHLVDGVAEWSPKSSGKRIAGTRKALLDAGFESRLAAELAALPALNPALDVINVAADAKLPVRRVSGVYYQLNRAMKLSWLMRKIEGLPVEGQWHANARGGLRDELFRHHRTLTSLIVRHGVDENADAEVTVQNWMQANSTQLSYFTQMIGDMKNTGIMDYATVSVAVRALDQVVRNLS